MQQIIDGDLNINVTSPIVNVPNTGLGSIVENLGGVGCSVVVATLVSLAAVITLFCLRKKLRGWRFFPLTIFSFIALTAALSVPVIAIASEAIQNAASTVNINVALEYGKSVTATAKTAVNIDAIDRPYMVYAYLEGNNTLHNLNNPNTVINPTLPTTSSDPNTLSPNSYGIQTSTTGGFVSLSNDSKNPTLLYASDEATTGSTIDITYGVKLDSKMLGGTYINASNKIKYVAEPQHKFTLNYASDEVYSSHIPSSDSYGPAAALAHQFTIPNDEDNIPTLWGKAFTGWCDGSIVAENTCDGTVYQPGDTITLSVDSATEINKTTTLNAMWKYVAITYNENEGMDPPQPTSMEEGATLPYTFTVTYGYPSRLGYDFDSWNTKPDGTGTEYKGGDELVSDTSVELYAIWTPITRTVTYKSSDGNTTYGTQIFTYNAAQNMRAYDADSGWTIKPVAPAIGATFMGWTKDKGSTTADYTDKQSISTLVDNITVYAIWEIPVTFSDAYAAAGKSKQGDYYKMQDMTSAICSAVTTTTTTGKEQTEVLIDTRDSKLYYVSKLQDGKCWMTQNLDLDITTAGLTNADTDLNSQTAWNSTSYPADPNTPGAINSPAATRTTTSSSSIYTDNLSWSLGDYAHDGKTVQTCGTVTSYSGCAGFSTTDAITVKANHYHVGNLYKFNTATAGSGVTITETGKQAPDSICPKGWRLPTGGTTGEFNALVTTYSIGASHQALVNSPFYMTRAGQVNDKSKLTLAGQNSIYYSSTVKFSSTDRSAYALFVSKTGVSLDFANKQYMGWAVRCVAR